MMSTILTTRPAAVVPRKHRSLQHQPERKVKSLPEYLIPEQVQALLLQAPHAEARLAMLVQWRAGLRVSETLALEVQDIILDGDEPSIRIRRGKGNKPRLVPVHPELGAAFRMALNYRRTRTGRIFTATTRVTAWRWVQSALERAIELRLIPPGRTVGTHTLRHSAARHWLASGVPINHVSRWLGHASLQTTLVYLEILPDPAGYMDRVP